MNTIMEHDENRIRGGEWDGYTTAQRDRMLAMRTRTIPPASPAMVPLTEPLPPELPAANGSSNGTVKARGSRAKLAAKRGRGGKPAPRSSASRRETAAIRQWAITQRPDLGCKERGKIPERVFTEYAAAH